MRTLVLLAFGALIVAGCVHFGKIATDIAPTAATPVKYPASMGLFYTTRLTNCLVVRKPGTMYGGSHEYRYHWGPALQAALTKSVEAAYANVRVVNRLPSPGEFDRVIKFDLTWVDLAVEFVPGYLRQEAKADSAVHIEMEIFDGKTMRSVKKLPVVGKGSSRKDASGFSAYASKQFTLATEKAIQQLSEIVTHLLITGTAEPERKS
uniref:ABC-type transport auxiliary lipoprotein component domain-containing protein n=1 Tax=Desulfobacca acetoxidans TaxID=60893 RepID=A0A7C3V036_9BACT